MWIKDVEGNLVNLHHVRQVIAYDGCVRAFFEADEDPSLLFKSDDEDLLLAYRDRLASKLAAAGLLLDMDEPEPVSPSDEEKMQEVEATFRSLFGALERALSEGAHSSYCRLMKRELTACTCWKAEVRRVIEEATGEEASK